MVMPILRSPRITLYQLKSQKYGGGDNYGNLQLVHLYCHQQIHSGTICSL
ncbi:HNH endonuclease [uncultured Nostoc sp.]